MILNEPAGKIAVIVVQNTVKLLVQVGAFQRCLPIRVIMQLDSLGSMIATRIG